MTDEAHTEAATSKIEIPAVARDLAARAVKSAQERAEALKASAEKATAQIESGLNTAATTLADASRNVQGAIYDDVKATLAVVEKIASAKSLAEAAQIHVQFLGDRSQVGLARMAKANEYVAKALQEAAKTAQDMGAACAAFQEAVKSKTVAHVGQGELDTAMTHARTRYTGETEVWDRREQSIDISPLVACSAAFYRWGLLDHSYAVLDSIW